MPLEFRWTGRSIQSRFEFDPTRRRVSHTWRGELRGPDLINVYAAMLTEWPDAQDFDLLINMLEGRQEVTSADVSALAELFPPQPERTGPAPRVAMISRDPNFPLWARAMDFTFHDGRQHHVFTTVEAATAFLDGAEAA